MNRSIRAAVAMCTAAAFLLAGCERPVQVPNERLAPATEWEGLYRVTTTTDQFTTRHFSVTDSTMVITKLGGSDKHYGRIQLPITIPIEAVRSVDHLGANNSHTALAVGGILVLAGIIVFLATFRIDIE